MPGLPYTIYFPLVSDLEYPPKMLGWCEEAAQVLASDSRVTADRRLFTLRGANGELFQATASTAGIETAPLAMAVQALFLTISWAGLHVYPLAMTPRGTKFQVWWRTRVQNEPQSSLPH